MASETSAQKVLVVEDEPFVLDLIVTRLALAGYATFSARDGHQAIRRLTEVRPAAMVLDINMPRMDGFEVLRHMQRGRPAQFIPTMVLTARNQASDVKMALELGAKDFLAKPFKDEHLLTRVARLLRSRPAA